MWRWWRRRMRRLRWRLTQDHHARTSRREDPNKARMPALLCVAEHGGFLVYRHLCLNSDKTHRLMTLASLVSPACLLGIDDGGVDRVARRPAITCK